MAAFVSQLISRYHQRYTTRLSIVDIGNAVLNTASTPHGTKVASRTLARRASNARMPLDGHIFFYLPSALHLLLSSYCCVDDWIHLSQCSRAHHQFAQRPECDHYWKLAGVMLPALCRRLGCDYKLLTIANAFLPTLSIAHQPSSGICNTLTIDNANPTTDIHEVMLNEPNSIMTTTNDLVAILDPSVEAAAIAAAVAAAPLVIMPPTKLDRRRSGSYYPVPSPPSLDTDPDEDADPATRITWRYRFMQCYLAPPLVRDRFIRVYPPH
jgi:hypothetical protein